MRSRSALGGLLLCLLMLLTACGAADEGELALPDDPAVSEDGSAGGGAAGTCLEGTPDCQDADLSGGEAPPDELPPLDADAVRADAQALLGLSEEEALAAADDVRLGRRGDEQMALTEDFRPGRKTIATEADASGTFRVVEVVLELDEGTETFTAE